MKGNKTLYYTLGAVVLLVLGILFLKFELPVVSVTAEKLPGWQIGPLHITNSLFTSWIVILVIALVTYLGSRKMQMVPSGLQNVLEFLVEALYNLTESVSGPKWVSRFFVIPATIFFYVLVSNLIGLLPGLSGIGLCAEHHAPATAEAAPHAEAATHEEASPAGNGFRLGNTCEKGQVIVPFLRSPSADLNFTLVLALITQLVAQYFGFSALGFGGYASKFIVLDGIKAAFKPDEHGHKRSTGGMVGQLMLGLINFAVGLLELLSEFVKIIAFTFRLFGNVFAGEVMLIVLTFLVPLMLTLPFLGFEIFVGGVQAFIFFILSVAFYSVAVTSHEHEEAH